MTTIRQFKGGAHARSPRCLSEWLDAAGVPLARCSLGLDGNRCVVRRTNGTAVGIPIALRLSSIHGAIIRAG